MADLIQVNRNELITKCGVFVFFDVDGTPIDLRSDSNTTTLPYQCNLQTHYIIEKGLLQALCVLYLGQLEEGYP